jgi:two-component system, OmpR family, phosphate regulon response regulator PhoB
MPENDYVAQGVQMASVGPGRRVLVVDDDEGVRTAVTWALEADGFAVQQTGDGLGALAMLAACPPALMVLDLSLPGLGGLDVLSRLRAGERATGSPPLPVIVLSGRTSETDRIVGLDLGADDYLIKPFSPGELAARARSLLRRSERVTPTEDEQQGVRIDTVTRDVTIDGRPVDLTAKEFDLLAHLAAHPRRVFSREQLLASVWGSEPGWQSDATITEHIHRLRQKIEADPRRPARLRTVRGVGYRWEP